VTVQLIWLGLAGFDVDVMVPAPLPALLAANPAVTVKLVPLVAVP
jgi:hypothetical protein